MHEWDYSAVSKEIDERINKDRNSIDTGRRTIEIVDFFKKIFANSDFNLMVYGPSTQGVMCFNMIELSIDFIYKGAGGCKEAETLEKLHRYL